MNYRQLLLLLFSMLAVVLFFHIPANSKWLDARILNFTDHIYDELDHMDYESRREYRYGVTYRDAKDLKKFIQSKTTGPFLLLMPPSSYTQAKHIEGNIPEPIVVYYYTGMRAVSVNSKHVYECTWGLVARNGALQLVSIRDKKTLEQLLNLYKHPELEI